MAIVQSEITSKKRETVQLPPPEGAQRDATPQIMMSQGHTRPVIRP